MNKESKNGTLENQGNFNIIILLTEKIDTFLPSINNYHYRSYYYNQSICHHTLKLENGVMLSLWTCNIKNINTTVTSTNAVKSYRCSPINESKSSLPQPGSMKQCKYIRSSLPSSPGQSNSNFTSQFVISSFLWISWICH